MNRPESSSGEKVRLDKWLWAARFFKTRALASEAVSGGKVHLAGQRVKPGKEIAPGALLTIHKDQYTWEIRVLALSRQRRGAAEAVLLYEESPQSHARRQAQVAERREERALYGDASHRPNKRERRQIRQFTHGE